MAGIKQRGHHVIKSDEQSAEELAELRRERQTAEDMGLRWQDRGPPGEVGQTWRGMPWRPESGKWGTRAGWASDWWKGLYKAKGRAKKLEEQGRWQEGGWVEWKRLARGSRRPRSQAPNASWLPRATHVAPRSAIEDHCDRWPSLS